MGISTEILKKHYPGWNCDKCSVPNSLLIPASKTDIPKNINPYADSYITISCTPIKTPPGIVRIEAHVTREFVIKGEIYGRNEVESDKFQRDITNMCPTKDKKMPEDRYLANLSKILKQE